MEPSETRTRTQRQVKGPQAARNPKPAPYVHNALPRTGTGPTIAAAPSATPSAPSATPSAPSATPSARKYGRTPGDGQLEYPVRSLKHSLRSYYGNLPQGTSMPSRVELDELLPPDLVALLNVPGDSRVTEIGHHAADTREGLEAALKMAEDQPGHLGITVITPDGEQVREYIFAQP